MLLIDTRIISSLMSYVGSVLRCCVKPASREGRSGRPPPDPTTNLPDFDVSFSPPPPRRSPPTRRNLHILCEISSAFLSPPSKFIRRLFSSFSSLDIVVVGDVRPTSLQRTDEQVNAILTIWCELGFRSAIFHFLWFCHFGFVRAQYKSASWRLGE